jgi:hypothetical protein
MACCPDAVGEIGVLEIEEVVLGEAVRIRPSLESERYGSTGDEPGVLDRLARTLDTFRRLSGRLDKLDRLF